MQEQGLQVLEQNKSPPDVYAADCSSRILLDQIADKWSVLILATLCKSPLRFNEIRRRLDGITQKALTQSLRRLERNGILSRRVIPSSQVAVEYSVTDLGHTLEEPFRALYRWTVQHSDAVINAQAAFDKLAEEQQQEG